MLLRPILISLLLLCSVGCTFATDTAPRLRPGDWATPVISSRFDNWYKVDDRVYRGEQPDDEGLQELARFGIRRVLSLCNFHSDDDELRESTTALTLYRVPMQAESISDAEVIAALKAILADESPILVHCWHGSDRTGTVIAMYRIIVQGWTREAALDELINGGYGYHALYRNIPEYIRNVDLESIRAGLSAP